MASEFSGTRRPGGRTGRTRLAALNATLELLGERGYAELTVEAVAERSGVHKTTLYRRWESAEGLVAAALLMGTEQPWEAPDTGSLEGDLREVNLELVHYFTAPGERELPTASISAAFLSPRAAEALREFYVDRHARSAPIVERAAGRGEVPLGTDPVEVVRVACGPIFYRLFVSREGVTPQDADVAARAAAAAAKAGVFTAKTGGTASPPA
ncbi:TetR/AcrR family transcriptional regulator [Amycolatopsis australiensis]|uniref:DNA-binding transcriptional regulator, AcrR family n=1 Tax=Amycolatopsis australiensis TaxID=546364 RepID=A0A1K1T4W7_9PSEU|nr:TetR/AcrR family transcriptional regulator [Amycolatopsis australiensis]SFW91580.1 DNA-binding transcriptional regulator, AcrR family [Amycolatopsis australiensis]